jgi:hypothetical protein
VEKRSDVQRGIEPIYQPEERSARQSSSSFMGHLRWRAVVFFFAGLSSTQGSDFFNEQDCSA